MANHQHCKYNCGATDCDAPLDVRRQAQNELDREKYREEVESCKAKIIEERDKGSLWERVLSWFVKPIIIYKHYPEYMEVGVYDGSECLKIVKWTATDEMHKIKVKLSVYKDSEYLGDKDITLDIRRPKP